MRQIWLLLAVVSVSQCQINLGGRSNPKVEARNVQSKVPYVGEEFGGNQQCCCVPLDQQCGESFQEVDYVESGLINPRGKVLTRIVNRPSSSGTSQPQRFCPSGHKSCCYNNNVDLSVIGRTCIPPVSEKWTQKCDEGIPISSSVKTCGTRNGYSSSLAGLAYAEASPGEFPWTCLILNQNNDFIGSCALIPATSGNNNNQGVKIITAAHKLNTTDVLKVRVGEYDASGFNKQTEIQEHEEYTVTRVLKHPRFNQYRLSNDIALLFVDRPINLNHPLVNTACLPSCRDQFSHTFSNNSGVRCWVAGWGKDEFNGNFQFIPHKVDIPLVPQSSCQPRLQAALNGQKAGSGNRFRLASDEICAGGEEGKDACTGDGGSPLVCQSESGQWTVVGLVTWGVGCANTVPGVYARVSQFLAWIDQNPNPTY